MCQPQSPWERCAWLLPWYRRNICWRTSRALGEDGPPGEGHKASVGVRLAHVSVLLTSCSPFFCMNLCWLIASRQDRLLLAGDLFAQTLVSFAVLGSEIHGEVLRLKDGADLKLCSASEGS